MFICNHTCYKILKKKISKERSKKMFVPTDSLSYVKVNHFILKLLNKIHFLGKKKTNIQKDPQVYGNIGIATYLDQKQFNCEISEHFELHTLLSRRFVCFNSPGL